MAKTATKQIEKRGVTTPRRSGDPIVRNRCERITKLAQYYALSERSIRRWLDVDMEPRVYPHTEEGPFLTIEKAAELIHWSKARMRKACQRGRDTAGPNDLRDCFILPCREKHADFVGLVVGQHVPDESKEILNRVKPEDFVPGIHIDGLEANTKDLLSDAKTDAEAATNELHGNILSENDEASVAISALSGIFDRHLASIRASEAEALQRLGKPVTRISYIRLMRFVYYHSERMGKGMQAWIERTEGDLRQAYRDLNADPAAGAQPYSGVPVDFACPAGRETLSDWLQCLLPPAPHPDSVGHQARLVIRLDQHTTLRLLFPKQAGPESRVQAFLCRNGEIVEVALDALVKAPCS